VTSRTPPAARRPASGPGLRQHAGHRAEDLRPAGVGHDAEGAELVAAFLHREEGGRSEPPAGGQVVELILYGKVRIDHPALGRAGEEVRQAVIALRAHHHVHGGLARLDLSAFRLRHATGHDDSRVEPTTAPFLLQDAQSPEFGVDLLGRLLADVAGVEDDDVGVFHGVGGGVTLGTQHVGHAGRVIGVHLAAVGLDEGFLQRAVIRFGARGGGRSSPGL